MPASWPPAVAFDVEPTPVEELRRLRDVIGGPRLFVKRDDAIRFAFGGNKVRKMAVVAADAVDSRADTLITSGGVQSNHARVTAAAAARLGLRCILIVNGEPPEKPTANALLDRLLGAEVRYVPDRNSRSAGMEAAAQEERARGRRPYVIPLGASTPLGACAYARAVEELTLQVDPPDVIVHSTSSGGTQAGLVAGCLLHGLNARVIGISADEASGVLSRDIAAILAGMPEVLQIPGDSFAGAPIEVDDRFVGGGYGVPTAGSREAIELCARTEALFLDPTYTSKAMAGLIARIREGEFADASSVLFWHTGGQVGLFA
jgi:1-aminocyclopropane-1-carboxylate deaminase/D-cysteine desulfhydrase-like pyridoxal-dependent ACC family enzyme